MGFGDKTRNCRLRTHAANLAWSEILHLVSGGLKNKLIALFCMKVVLEAIINREDSDGAHVCIACDKISRCLTFFYNAYEPCVEFAIKAQECAKSSRVLRCDGFEFHKIKRKCTFGAHVMNYKSTQFYNRTFLPINNEFDGFCG